MLKINEMRNIGTMPSKTFVDFGDLRVHTISKIVLDGDNEPCYVNLSPAYGLGIEQKCSNGQYIVICFIKYNKKEDCVEYEPVGERILDYIGEDTDRYLIFKEAYNKAKSIVGEEVVRHGERYED